MIKPININSSSTITNLQELRYSIFLLGGFGVKINDFSISFSNINTGELVTVQKISFPVQSHFNYKRAKRIFRVDIPTEGLYKVIFHNPNSIKVKRSNLGMFNWIYAPISNQYLEILITAKFSI